MISRLFKKNKNHTSKNVQKNNKFLLNFRKYMKEYGEFTGIHGFRYLTEDRSLCEKIFWGVILLMALVGWIYLVAELLRKYIYNPTVISFATETTPIYQIPFPAVTICSESKVSRNIFDYQNILFRIQNGMNTTSEERYNLSNIAILCNEVDSTFVTFKNNTNASDDLYNIAHEFRPHYFDNNICSFMDEQDCSSMFSPMITDQGICYSFNSLSKVDQFKPNVVIPDQLLYTPENRQNFYEESGYTKEAGVITYPRRALLSSAANPLEVIFECWQDTDYACTKGSDGFRILLHNPLVIPRLSRDYVRMPTNAAVTISVYPELTVTSHSVKGSAPDSRRCYFKTERFLKFFQFYTQSNCLLECLTNYTLGMCGCVSFFMPRDDKTAVCGISQTECVKKAELSMKLEEVTIKLSENSDYKLYCDCKPSCFDLRYKADVSYSSFDQYIPTNAGPQCNALNCSYSKLSVYMKDEEFTAIQRNIVYEIVDLISNIGGLMGLFVGFSLLTVIEILYFATLRLHYNKKLYNDWGGA